MYRDVWLHQYRRRDLDTTKLSRIVDAKEQANEVAGSWKTWGDA